MHVARVLAALVVGGLASLIVAHPLAEALRPVWGDTAGLRAALGAPLLVGLAAFVVYALTCPLKAVK